MNWTRRRTLVSAIGVGVAALAGCLDDEHEDRSLPETPTGTWHQSGHDAGNTCASDVAVPPRGTLAWVGGDVRTVPPAVAGGSVFAVADSLTALDARTGDQQWQTDLDVETGGPGVTAPAVTADRVLLGVEGQIAAFAREDGDTDWELSVDGRVRGPMTVGPDDQLAVVPVERPGSGAVELLAVHPSRGDRAWTAPLLVSTRTAPPAVSGTHVYGAGYTVEDTPVLRGFDASDGELRWERSLDSPETPPVTTDAGVFVGDDGLLRGFTPSGEEPRQVFDPPEENAAITALAVAGETAFVLSDAGLSAVSLPDGTRQWHLDAQPRADGICVGRDTVVAPVSSDAFDLDTDWPCIAALDRATGAIRWYHPVDDAFDPRISTTPVIADSAVFYTSNTVSGVAALGDLPPREE